MNFIAFIIAIAIPLVIKIEVTHSCVQCLYKEEQPLPQPAVAFHNVAFNPRDYKYHPSPTSSSLWSQVSSSSISNWSYQKRNLSNCLVIFYSATRDPDPTGLFSTCAMDFVTNISEYSKDLKREPWLHWEIKYLNKNLWWQEERLRGRWSTPGWSARCWKDCHRAGNG